ncbi:MAG TPA: phage tail protein [Streptosporangiaceae bacterium]|nr:phage tail protein [Streptosporangiaceae bacterium]
MSVTSGDERPVYDLLPVIHRIRDAERGLPLRALLEVTETELAQLRDDVDGLYDDWFVETCAEWVLPYIGDLLGVQGLRPVPGAAGLRALVANTIRYRRRKGTPGVIEQVARDVTGWPARVVEYYRLLSLTQHLDHVRLGAARTADLRDAAGLALTGTPFDETARTGEVRHIDIGRGRYNLPDVGVHLWRLGAYPVALGDARARPAGPGWTFDPAGRDVPLFHRAKTEPDTVTHLAEEVDVPAPLRRRALIRELTPPQQLVFLAEPDPALRIVLDGQQVTPDRLTCRDLSDWTPSGDGSVTVDPVLGRIMPPAPAPRRVQVDYSYGYPGDVGAGPHDRRATLASALDLTDPAPPVDWSVQVARDGPIVPGRTVTTLGDALRLWNARTDQAPGRIGVIAVTDSATYTEDLQVVIPAGNRLLLVAADWPAMDPAAPAPGLDVLPQSARGLRPHLAGGIQVTGTGGTGCEFLLDGLSVEGAVEVQPGDLGSLVVSDSTLTAGRVTVCGNQHLAVGVLRSVLAGLTLPGVPSLSLADSLLYDPAQAVDAADARVDVQGCTLFGPCMARILTAGNSLFCGAVDVRQVQDGCVRFSYLAPGSRTPRRYHCQPTTPAAAGRVAPRFTSDRPADPGFGQLAPSCPPEITTGADDEGEMGAYHFLQQSLRLANLASQLTAYLRFGLEAGVFFAT